MECQLGKYDKEIRLSRKDLTFADRVFRIVNIMLLLIFGVRTLFTGSSTMERWGL